MFSEADTYFTILLAVQIVILVVLGVQSLHTASRPIQSATGLYRHDSRRPSGARFGNHRVRRSQSHCSRSAPSWPTSKPRSLILNRKEPDLAAVRDLLADVRKEDLRANRFVESMRLPLRKHELHFERVDMNELTAEVLSMMLPDALRRKVTIQSTLEPGLPRIPADRLQLQQVLLNLVDNALDAMDDTPSRSRRLQVFTESQDDEHCESRRARQAAAASIPRKRSGCSIRSSPPRAIDWAWACRWRAPSCTCMAGNSGPRAAPPVAPLSSSPCRCHKRSRLRPIGRARS